MVYHKVTVPDQKVKAWAIYRDDMTNPDGFTDTLTEAISDVHQGEQNDARMGLT